MSHRSPASTSAAFDAGSAAIVATIEARMTSTRLPGKILADIEGMPLLEIMIRRLRTAQTLTDICVATTTNPEDDPVVELARSLDVGCFRGSENDVLGRVLAAAESMQADVIVETTGDCPLIDPVVLDACVFAYFASDVHYCSNTLTRRFPRGLDVEVFARDVLAEVSSRTDAPVDHEHVSIYIYEHPDRYALRSVPAVGVLSRPEWRWTVDVAADLEFVRAIVRELGPDAPASVIANWLESRPDVIAMNSHVAQKPVRGPGSPVAFRVPAFNEKEGVGAAVQVMDAVVVGLGRIGATFRSDPKRAGIVTHAEALQQHPVTKLVAGVDPDEGRRAKFERDYGESAYASWDEMLRHHSPEIVSICTPPSAHSEGVLQALDAGARRVICEKPCTESLDEIEDLVTRVGERGGAVGINYSRRFDPLHRRVLSMAAAQRIRGVIGHYTAGILNTGSHWLADLISLGRPIERVRALPLDDGDDPTPCLLLFLGGGAVAYLEGHFVSDYLIYEMDVFTDEARVSLLDSGTGARILSRGESPRFSGYAELAPDGETLPQGLIDPLLAVVDDAVVSVKEDRPMLCPLADGVAVHKVIAAAHESLRTGADVPIEATR